MRNTPPYAVTSVDHALQLAALLQQEGTLRVTDAAERLGVSVSTAHRLLSMLVFRDFAEQYPDRRYGPGKMLRPVETSEAPVALLRRVSLPHLRRLVDQTQESTNLVVLAGTEVRFVATVESPRVLRVGDRLGRSLPAHRVSGGKAMLATLSPDHLAAWCRHLDEAEVRRLRHELAGIRKRGYAINDQATETGLTALGVAVKNRSAAPLAGLSLALPTARFRRAAVPEWVDLLSAAAEAIETALADEDAQRTDLAEN
jgi:IclR family transcriptional regulator, acetate operon repressor